MEKENRNLKVLVIILCVLLLGLGGYFFYDIVLSDDGNITTNKQNDTTLAQNNNIELETNCEKDYSYEEVEGYYSGNIYAENLEGLDGNGVLGLGTNVGYYLYLWKDGTFKYSYSAYAPLGWIGNYIIDGNTIILNYWYSTTSGTGFTVTSGSNKFVISKEGSILNYNYEYKDKATSEYVELVKDDSGEEISRINFFELRNIGPYEMTN